MKQVLLHRAIAAEQRHPMSCFATSRRSSLNASLHSQQHIITITTKSTVSRAPSTPFVPSPRFRQLGHLIIPSAASSPTPAEPPPASSDDETPFTPEVMGTKFSFEDVVYTINIIYFSVLLASIFTGNRHLTNIASFANFVTAMFLASAAFTGWSATRWLTDIREHLADAQRKKDFRALMRFGWSSVFWLGFVMWYAVPPMEALTQWTGTAGAICCLYGIALAGSSAMMVGSVSS